MPITDLLERNAHEFCHETALVEINPEVKEIRRVTWKEYELIESSPTESYRREITWGVFDEKANRCANLLLSRGIKKGDKVAILMMNSLEWLPLYFGILKTGALAVPLNFRYTAEEIKYCLELADVDALFFGPEFIGRVEDICDQIPRVKLRFFIGDGCPRFAENYMHLAANLSSYPPRILLSDDDDAASCCSISASCCRYSSAVVRCGSPTPSRLLHSTTIAIIINTETKNTKIESGLV